MIARYQAPSPSLRVGGRSVKATAEASSTPSPTRALPRPSSIPNEWRMVLILGALAVIVAAAFFQFGRSTRERIVTHTRIAHTTLAQEYGQPSKTIPGTDVNPSLTGFTCDVYQAKQAIVCHR